MARRDKLSPLAAGIGMAASPMVIGLPPSVDTPKSTVTNAQAGSGLLRYAGTLIPFVNRFKKDTELYRLITTKPGEVQKI